MRALALAVVLTGCAGLDTTTFHWPKALRPVTVIVDQTLPLECLAGVETAIAWWRYQGVDYLDSMPGQPSDKPLIGEVFVTWEDLEYPYLGRCDRLTFGDEMVKATIVLGLDHRDDLTALMHPEAGDRWGLSEEEVEAVQ